MKTTLRNGDVMDKMEVPINDESGLIKLTLWGPNIALVPHDGVYQILKAKVREWPKGVVMLNTTTSTIIFPAPDVHISPSKSNLPNLFSKTIQFPPLTIHSVQIQQVCPNCHQQSDNNGKLFKCPTCRSMTLATKLKHAYTIKIKFPDQLIVTLFHNQVENDFQGNIPSDEDDILFNILKDDVTTIIVNSRGVCIGFGSV